MFTMSIKREIRRLASFSRAVTAKKCTKRRDKRYALAVQFHALPLIGSRSGEELGTMPHNTSLDPGQYLLGILTKIGDKRQIYISTS